MTDAPHVRVERQGSATVITLCRAAKKNAIAKRTALELASALESASADPAVRGVVLAAEGDVFMAGGDLSEFATILDDPQGSSHVIEMGERLAVIERCEVPVVAAVSGDVYGGGCELVLQCDAVLAEEHVGLSFRHARMGLSPAWGGARRLLERAGPLHASRLLFTADRVDAKEAYAIGLVTRVVERGASLDEALAFVERVAKNDRAVVAANKRALNDARNVRRFELAEIEARTFRQLWGKPAHRAALSGKAPDATTRGGGPSKS